MNVDYGKLYNNRYKVLEKAFLAFKDQKKLEKFIEENKEWLENYALFMALKGYFLGKAWVNWDEDIKNREEKIRKIY